MANDRTMSYLYSKIAYVKDMDTIDMILEIVVLPLKSEHVLSTRQKEMIHNLYYQKLISIIKNTIDSAILKIKK